MPIVEVPGMGDVEFPDDMSDDQIAAAIKKNLEPDTSAKVSARTGDNDFFGALMRPVTKGVSALTGGMAADAGISLRNLGQSMASASGLDKPIYRLNQALAGDSTVLQALLPQGPGKADLFMPEFNAAIDRAYPAPERGINKGAEFLSTALVGSRMPVPQSAQLAPKDFVKPATDLVRQQTLANSQRAGYVVPPSTTNPTGLNKVLESVGGKIATEQDAALANQGITNTLAKRTLGLSDDAPLTQEAIGSLRREAGDAYEILRGAGNIVADEQYSDDLAKVAAKYSGASKDFPELAKSDVTDLVAGVSKKEFSSDSAVDLLSILRDKADRAYATGDKGLGGAYKKVSKAVEDVVERNLKGQGKTDLVKQFKDARQLIAKSYSVEKAFNPATGNVNATKLAAQLNKGKPLSGDLVTAARFGQAFPKAAREIVDSGSVRNTDVILGAGTAALAREPTYLMYPFARQAVRAGLLSGPGQSLAVPGVSNGFPPGVLMGGLTAEEQARYALLGE